MPIRVVVADDDDDVRAAEVELLTRDPRFDVVSAVGTAEDVVRDVLAHRPDVAVLDLRMPGGGVQAARAINESGVATVVVVLSGSVNAAALVELLRAGVRGAVLKGSGPPGLLDVIERCRNGEVVLLVPTAARALAHLTASLREQR